MSFNSLEFALFFIVVFFTYYFLTHKWQNLLLLLASYFFYGFNNWRFLLLVIVSTIVDFFCGLILAKTNDQGKRRLILLTSIITNLGILGFFKYYNFFVENLSETFTLIGISVDWRLRDIVLPIGISFYTLQTLSYTIDVFRNKTMPTKNFFEFALFVAFFPQLLAGPIERAQNLLTQFEKARYLSSERFKFGLYLIIFGLFQKTVVADNLAPFAKDLFSRPHYHSGTEILFGLYGSFFMLYADFCGYSNIARGLAQLLGIKISENFRRPFFSEDPEEFWSRWHLTLTQWIKDYVYIPILQLTTYPPLQLIVYIFAILLTFFLIGLWHGAAWNFIYWGLGNALVFLFYKFIYWVIKCFKHIFDFQGTLPRWSKIAIYFHLVVIGVGQLFFIQKMSHVPLLWRGFWRRFTYNGETLLMTLAVFVVPMLIYEYFQEQKKASNLFLKWPNAIQTLFIAILLIFILLSGNTGTYEFVYFHF